MNGFTYEKKETEMATAVFKGVMWNTLCIKIGHFGILDLNEFKYENHYLYFRHMYY